MENKILENSELCHHGIKGQRWGFRRYQNKDGTLTPAGKKRYEKEMAEIKKEAKILRQKQRTADKIEKLNSERQKVEEGKRALEEFKKRGYKKEEANNDAESKPKTETKNETKTETKAKPEKESSNPKLLEKRTLKSLSDDELKARLNRLQMEKQYKELTATPKKVSLGKRFVTTLGKDIIAPAAIDVGKQWFKSFLVEKLNDKLELDEEYKLHTNNKKK